MRSLLCAFLSVCLLVPCANTRAEEDISGQRVAVEVGYAGDWYWFEQFQFGLLLPKTWRAVPAKDEVYFMAVDESGRQALWVELYHSEGNSMDMVLGDLKALPQFSAVEGVYYNGVPFVRYTAPKGNLLGFATLTAREDILLFFKFMPADDRALEELAEQIMATVSPVDRESVEDPDESGRNGS